MKEFYITILILSIIAIILKVSCKIFNFWLFSRLVYNFEFNICRNEDFFYYSKTNMNYNVTFN